MSYAAPTQQPTPSIYQPQYYRDSSTSLVMEYSDDGDDDDDSIGDYVDNADDGSGGGDNDDYNYDYNNDDEYDYRMLPMFSAAAGNSSSAFFFNKIVFSKFSVSISKDDN